MVFHIESTRGLLAEYALHQIVMEVLYLMKKMYTSNRLRYEILSNVYIRIQLNVVVMKLIISAGIFGGEKRNTLIETLIKTKAQ